MPTLDPAGRSDLLQPGQTFGKFYLVQLIGEGGTSRIFKALQQPISRLVALKIPSFAHSGTILTPDEFLSEATLMARLDHGNVVRIHDFGVHEDSAFICMEHVDGGNLQELTESRGPLSVSAVLALGIQTLDGLLHSHSRGVLHLDLSPANVLVAKSGTVKLSDFGMAGKRKASGGRIVGTPAFLSPEHVAGTAGMPQSDLFSFASLLYYAATGTPLFDPGDRNQRVDEALGEIRTARETPPDSRIRRLPKLLIKPVATALQSLDPMRLSRELMEAWKKVEGEERPDTVLQRELDLERGPSAWDPGSGDAPQGPELRDRYLALRKDGRHREAVALLEKALRSDPDDPLLRELLATPPAKAKSAPVTVDVGVRMPVPDPAIAPSARSRADAASGRPPRGSHARRFAGASAGVLAIALAFLGWSQFKGGGRHAAGEPVHDDAAPPGRAPESGTAPVAGAAFVAGAPSAGAAGPAATDHPAPRASRERKSSAIAGAAAKKVRSLESRSGTGALPPAVSLVGPAGTRVSVNDTAEWISPSPKAGWTLSPGLVNITLSPPGPGRPISSSLFVSADTLYLLNLEEDGGFSVTRRRR